MFNKIFIDNICIGEHFVTPRFGVFFGNKFGDLDKIKKHFHFLKFSSMNQIHSNLWSIAQDTAPTCDGLYTHQPGIALLVKTADCIPLLIANENEIAAVHCGWRGVYENIINNNELYDFNNSVAFIGPHIQWDSFEVDKDLNTKFELLLKKMNIDKMQVIKPSNNPNKFLVNLSRIVKAQLGEKKSILNYISNQDTLLDSDYNSFRRDKEKSQRQYSFIYKTHNTKK